MRHVLVTAALDCFHAGHADFLSRAAVFGDHLTLALDSDARIAQAKGAGRPVYPLAERIAIAGSLSYVDDVVSFDTLGQLVDLCQQLTPIRVLGMDHWHGEIIGKEFCSAVVFLPRGNWELSTTAIIERIRRARVS